MATSLPAWAHQTSFKADAPLMANLLLETTCHCWGSRGPSIHPVHTGKECGMHGGPHDVVLIIHIFLQAVEQFALLCCPWFNGPIKWWCDSMKIWLDNWPLVTLEDFPNSFFASPTTECTLLSANHKVIFSHWASHSGNSHKFRLMVLSSFLWSGISLGCRNTFLSSVETVTRLWAFWVPSVLTQYMRCVFAAADRDLCSISVLWWLQLSYGMIRLEQVPPTIDLGWKWESRLTSQRNVGYLNFMEIKYGKLCHYSKRTGTLQYMLYHIQWVLSPLLEKQLWVFWLSAVKIDPSNEWARRNECIGVGGGAGGLFFVLQCSYMGIWSYHCINILVRGCQKKKRGKFITSLLALLILVFSYLPATLYSF